MNEANQVRVSLIIPVYNTEKFVSRAIDSVLAQSYGNFELILVNDGSTDQSGEICDEYARKHPKIKVIHQSNRGVSAARNAALDICSGEYIQFLDSDDELDPTRIETLVRAIVLNNCDTVICGYLEIGRSVKEISAKSGLYHKKDFIMLAYTDPVVASLVFGSCYMIFKKTIIEHFRIRFDSEYRIGEDRLFTLEYLLNSNKVLVMEQALYKRYIFEPEERISAVSHCALDVYELRIEYSRRLFSSYRHDGTGSGESVLLATFYGNIIAGLVRLAAYSEYFSDKDMRERLTSVVNNEMVINGGRVYKRKGKGDSYFIPLFMRWRAIGLLRFALRLKGKDYIKKYGKQEHVCSVFTSINFQHL